ncbi:bifunctional AAA family ATPase chaperone/translocase BCS1 [Tupanvirus deep ocean]|uniref:Bifunctional AAA family ATPase chaperone/translocase BCS1 n=2 Tax=Tupanvirus TaxID=2094720 RepID=A0AC62A9S3_9VIRU|nr:bifunctional AAA family ATPase chaperone/translocase BCS1 [Tupanvirus deep ocean]QKU34459.1 bifunctional AAA family ATPase chaperone/translocase BCS1 [Tupanvirus deep ocean]
MNIAFNTTGFANPFMGPGMVYGGNFVDVLFRHLMEQGWDGLTFMAILNFYMYLSLDRIKDLFKYLNDKVAVYGKNNLEHYGHYTLEKSKTYSLLALDKIKNIKLAKKGTEFVSETNKPNNQIMITLNCSNKPDLMALGNFILKNRKHIDLHNYYRESSDKYKIVEAYQLPNCVVFNNDVIVDILSNHKTLTDKNLESTDKNLESTNKNLESTDKNLQLTDKNLESTNKNLESTDKNLELTNEKLVIPVSDNNKIVLRITQNVDYSLVCESDGQTEQLKDVRIKITETNVDIVWSDFRNIAKKLDCPFRDCPLFDSSNGWCSSPSSFLNGRCYSILFYIYYSRNFNLFKNLFYFLAGKESFDFMGKKYKLVGSCCDLCTDFLKEDEMKKFIEDLTKYCNDKLIPKFDSRKTEVEAWISNNKHFFEPILNNTPAVNIYFESEEIDCSVLSEYSRKFMKNLMIDYYHQTFDNIGNKISIYQLNIRYDIETEKKENPEYAEWQKKYGKKTKETSKASSDDKTTEPNSTTTETDTKDKSKDDTKTETTGGDGATSNNKPDDKNTANNTQKNNTDDFFGDMYDYPYMPRHYRGYKYIPPEPEKFIQQETKIPVAESRHVKSDKKPIQHLYLQKSAKDLLQSYLSNFKNNRELYEKLGIPYKGGILLSGEPGCGKSSTIMAVATYLNKDIYYLDLNKIKTNHELKLCIDYVKTNSQKGGVIIFEDIDCMTDIVKKRTFEIKDENNSVTKSMNTENDALSLSFLLNILDGTMAPEDIIFVMTTNHQEILDPALIRPGRMDISIEIKKCDCYQLQQIYYDLYGHYLDQTILKRFKEYQFITAEVILHLFHNIYNKHLTGEELLRKFLN